MEKNTYLVQNSKVAYRLIDGEAVLVDLSDSKLYSLNSVATLIWEASNEKTSIEEIINRIMEEFNVERATAEKDCMAFIEDFTGKGLLIVERQIKD